MSDLIYPNGVLIDSGDYAFPPIGAEELGALISGVGKEPPENLGELRARARGARSLGMIEGPDPRKLDEAGWGVIFADSADPAVERALAPLLALREAQAGARYRRYSGEAGGLGGFKVGKDSKGSFLARYGAAPGPVDPRKVPYYLLIVGDPETIPYSFQAQLDVQHAVGRIHFDSLEAYATYARSVVAAESGAVRLPRRATFFGVGHAATDAATAQSRSHLIQPLVEALGADARWQVAPPILDGAATKQALAAALGGGATPALLFTAGHGLLVPAQNRGRLRPEEYQGALVCADWPGPGHPFADPAFFFAGADLPRDASLLGLIGCFFACFGAGTPQRDAFTHLQRMRMGQQPGAPLELAPRPFVAGLPRRMLGAPGGGALAVIGHVERSWPGSFVWRAMPDGTLPPQTAAFESLLRRLMDGYPVGAAMEYMNQRYAELAADLKDELDNVRFPEFKGNVELANIWMAANDAQWYTIVGDPAARLPVVDAPAAADRPALSAVAAAPPAADAPGPAAAQTEKDPPMTPEDAADPRFAHAFTPPPLASPELAELKAGHPELYAGYVAHIQDGYTNNTRIFDDVRRAFIRSHYSTLVMYWLLFGVGVAALLGAIVAALLGQQLNPAIFLGLGVGAFITYFVSRSILSIEENLLFITWLGVIYNSYWTHLAWATKPETAQAELDKATADAIARLERLVGRHAESSRARPVFGRAEPPAEVPAAASPAAQGQPGAAEGAGGAP